MNMIKLFMKAMTLGLGFAMVAEPGHTQAITVGRSGAVARAQCVTTSAQEAAQVLEHTNAIRAQRGLPALRINNKLATAAARHACDMARRQQMTHIGSTTRGPGQRVKATGYRQSIVAENIAMGFRTAERVSGAWVASSSHLTNILLPQTREFGIGKAVDADGQVFWAAVYAAQR